MCRERPERLVVYYADLSKPERTWFGPVPVTSVQRTLNDCAREGLSPELLRQAARQALRRGDGSFYSRPCDCSWHELYPYPSS
jgi:hypothetical protein